MDNLHTFSLLPILNNTEVQSTESFQVFQVVGTLQTLS